MDKIYLDEHGYNEYLEEINELKEKLKENNSNITEYQSSDAYGDGWHDNFAYEQARKYEDSLFHQLNQKMDNLKNIVIVDDEVDENQIGLNCMVEVLFDNEDEVETFLLTGSYKSNIDGAIQTITLNSPLGNSIYKKRIGDTFSYKVNDKQINGKIINIKNKM